ncbi:hypothetical protein ACFQ60_47720 [Streptomyces zhihengii]
MGLCELAVTPPWQGRGIGSRLHHQLVTAIAPQWSSLLVHPDNPADAPSTTASATPTPPVPQRTPRARLRPARPPRRHGAAPGRLSGLTRGRDTRLPAAPGHVRVHAPPRRAHQESASADRAARQEQLRDALRRRSQPSAAGSRS